MSSKYSTKQYISAQYCDKQMSEIWCKNIRAFLRYSNFCVGIFYFASPCISCIHCITVMSLVYYVIIKAGLRQGWLKITSGYRYLSLEGEGMLNVRILCTIIMVHDDTSSFYR